MSKTSAPPGGRQSPAEVLLTFAATFLTMDTLLPGTPITTTGRWARRTAADAAARFHQHLHAEEDLTTPEEDLHTHLGPA